MSSVGPARAGSCVLLMVFAASIASAQTPQANPQPTSTIEFLPRFAFHLDAAHLSNSDPRLVWDANFGGEVDLVDYGVGRTTFAANYNVVLGEQIRKFDPNQGNYLLEGASSGRIGGVEIAAVFHHISRHLSDRPKTLAVDWNMIGGRVAKTFAIATTTMNARVDLRKTILHSYVDYDWELDAGLRNVYPLTSRVAAVSDVDLRLVGTDGSRSRGTQTGSRAEAGLLLQGKGASMELFIAAERRIDPFPLEFGVDSWVSGGFRILSR